jgi:peptidoglycan/LPS O-acetylase OafA/YrhL
MLPALRDIGPRSDSRATVTGVHIEALDGLRGLAVLLVLFFHYGRSANGFGFDHFLLSLSAFGWIGVDLFFVLSGFLITGVLYDARGSRNYFRNFYARRALRIFPLYFLALGVVIVLSALWPSAGIWPEFNPLWFVFYLSNVAQVTQAPLSAGILSHFWSLAVEEHFYLAWPMVVLLTTRRQMISIAAGVLILCVCARLALKLSGEASPYAIYRITPLRLDGLTVGAICSLAVRGPGGLTPLIRPAWMAALGGGTALVLVGSLTGSFDYYSWLMQEVGYTSLAIAFGGLLLIVLGVKAANDAFSNPLMRWFGRYSYGLYVWHPIINVILFYTPLKVALDVEGPVDSTLYLLFAFATALAVAFASYHLLEQPFLRLKKKFS